MKSALLQSSAQAPTRPARLLAVRNRQRTRSIRLPLFRRIILAVLSRLAPGQDFELCFHLVSANEISGLNERFLRHAGATDVIAFNLNEETKNLHLAGEIFICVEQAVRQGRTYRTSWQAEVVRYAVHGLLHLLGYDDLTPGKRRIMKREENRLMRELSKNFALDELARPLKATL